MTRFRRKLTPAFHRLPSDVSLPFSCLFHHFDSHVLPNRLLATLPIQNSYFKWFPEHIRVSRKADDFSLATEQERRATMLPYGQVAMPPLKRNRDFTTRQLYTHNHESAFFEDFDRLLMLRLYWMQQGY